MERFDRITTVRLLGGRDRAGHVLDAVIEEQRAAVPDMEKFPYLVEVAVELQKAGYDYATEFEYALDLILDGSSRSARSVELAQACDRCNIVILS